jgi:hypothetical protein
MTARVELDEARRRARLWPRSLRTVRELVPYDMLLVEDRATGDRRKVPNKTRLMHGLEVSFELAGDLSQPPESEDDS